jgi:hypothetical protein
MEDGAADWMVTLKKILGTQLCEDGRLTELASSRKGRWVLTGGGEPQLGSSYTGLKAVNVAEESLGLDRIY